MGKIKNEIFEIFLDHVRSAFEGTRWAASCNPEKIEYDILKIEHVSVKPLIGSASAKIPYILASAKYENDSIRFRCAMFDEDIELI